MKTAHHVLMSPSMHCTIVSFNYFFTTVRQAVKVTWFNLHLIKSAVNPNKVKLSTSLSLKSDAETLQKEVSFKILYHRLKETHADSLLVGHIAAWASPFLLQKKPERESAVAADFNASEKAKSARADVEPQTLIHCPSAEWGIGAMKADDGVVKFVERLSE